jgi:hypothetical protein
MSPLVLVAMIIAAALVLLLPRKSAIVPFLVFTFLTPLGQEFYFGGLHFFAQRIVILCGCLRLLSSRSSSPGGVLPGGFTKIDNAFTIWAIWRVFAFVLLYRQGSALTNQLGFVWDTLGAFFLARYLIRDIGDIRRVARVFVVIAVLMAACMLYEHYKLTNVFGLLTGGRVTVDIRAGRARCRGVFEQEILASAFGGTLVPLFLWLWKAGSSKLYAVIGMVAATVITITSASSTGISAYAFGILALCLWPLRKYMRQLRWCIVAAIVCLAFVMKAPVWFVLEHVDFAGGSTGWDRANLIDQCVRHFWDWWLVGTASYATWGDFTWDLCNQFVGEAETGGLATLVLFVTIIYRCFGKIGAARAAAEGNRPRGWLLWTLGALLCAHMAAFMGISYFDQTKVWWFVTLAMICTVTTTRRLQSGKSSERTLEVRKTGAPIPQAADLVSYQPIARIATRATC